MGFLALPPTPPSTVLASPAPPRPASGLPGADADQTLAVLEGLACLWRRNPAARRHFHGLGGGEALAAAVAALPLGAVARRGLADRLVELVLEEPEGPYVQNAYLLPLLLGLGVRCLGPEAGPGPPREAGAAAEAGAGGAWHALGRRVLEQLEHCLGGSLHNLAKAAQAGLAEAAFGAVWRAPASAAAPHLSRLLARVWRFRVPEATLRALLRAHRIDGAWQCGPCAGPGGRVGDEGPGPGGAGGGGGGPDDAGGRRWAGGSDGHGGGRGVAAGTAREARAGPQPPTAPHCRGAAPRARGGDEGGAEAAVPDGRAPPDRDGAGPPPAPGHQAASPSQAPALHPLLLHLLRSSAPAWAPEIVVPDGIGSRAEPLAVPFFSFAGVDSGISLCECSAWPAMDAGYSFLAWLRVESECAAAPDIGSLRHECAAAPEGAAALECAAAPDEGSARHARGAAPDGGAAAAAPPSRARSASEPRSESSALSQGTLHPSVPIVFSLLTPEDQGLELCLVGQRLALWYCSAGNRSALHGLGPVLDPGAWYHIALSQSRTHLRFWCNGVPTEPVPLPMPTFDPSPSASPVAPHATPSGPCAATPPPGTTPTADDARATPDAHPDRDAPPGPAATCLTRRFVGVSAGNWESGASVTAFQGQIAGLTFGAAPLLDADVAQAYGSGPAHVRRRPGTVHVHPAAVAGGRVYDAGPGDAGLLGRLARGTAVAWPQPLSAAMQRLGGVSLLLPLVALVAGGPRPEAQSAEAAQGCEATVTLSSPANASDASDLGVPVGGGRVRGRPSFQLRQRQQRLQWQMRWARWGMQMQGWGQAQGWTGGQWRGYRQ